MWVASFIIPSPKDQPPRKHGLIEELPGLVMSQLAIEHGPVEIVDLPFNKMVIFHSFLYVYQRVRGFAHMLSIIRTD